MALLAFVIYYFCFASFFFPKIKLYNFCHLANLVLSRAFLKGFSDVGFIRCSVQPSSLRGLLSVIGVTHPLGVRVLAKVFSTIVLSESHALIPFVMS
uniref:Uncharacterized protein n=1 Tax=Solanum lycopersicum TaxID=4081 RepID=A0A3Q7IP32_SOLLC